MFHVLKIAGKDWYNTTLEFPFSFGVAVGPD